MSYTLRQRNAGFTLIEAIMVIVITGIIAGVVAVFITRPVQGYVDSVRRAELTDAADVALRRITRDVRLALPNSLRPVANGIEFIMTKTGGRYRDPADGSTSGNFLTWTDTTDCTTMPDNCKFDVLGPPADPAIAAGDYFVIYNLGNGYNPANAYNYDGAACLAGGCNIAKVDAVGTNLIKLDANPFALQSPPLPSPNARFQVVDATDKVVRYICSGGTLTRFSGCDFNSTAAHCTSALLAGSATTEPKASCAIDYASAATGRNGLLYIQLTLTDTPSGESVTLFQQIHVDNAP